MGKEGLQPADRNPHQRPLSGERQGSLQGGVCYLRRHQPQQHRPAYPGEQGVPSPFFFAGEVLDIDAITGGFNLQAAWTTGYVVGQHIGE